MNACCALSMNDEKTGEALKEVGLANIAAEGRQNKFVSEEEVSQAVIRQGAPENDFWRSGSRTAPPP